MVHKIDKALVTGAGGFIGSHLVERLVSNGTRVTAFLHYNSRHDIGMLRYAPKEVMERVEIFFGDLKDAESVRKAAKGTDVIFHLGALIGIPYSYRNPHDVIETNIIGTLNVLTAAMENQVARIIHTSTSEVYGTARTEKIQETHPLQGQSPYSASKIGADKIVESFVNSYQLPAVTIRPFNTYGPRQSMRAVIPTIIAQTLFQNEIHVGSLDPVRDFTFVGDTVDAFLKGATVEGVEGEVFNLGTGREVSIGEIVKVIKSMTGMENKPVCVAKERLRPKNSEVMRLRSDFTKAKKILGWSPKTSFEDGLRATIDWIRAHSQDYSQSGYVV
ncbi:MAG: SDR family NAD(P)-dependent oxidoreductase [Deltaproteobacteria bacterium]|nr:SDR family NAD(P)-dependent oxidoreductase [Deltaproteobacteria bacterium]